MLATRFREASGWRATASGSPLASRTEATAPSFGLGALTNLLPTAEQVMEKVALAESEKATEEARRKAKAEEEKKALLESLSSLSASRMRRR
jgi:hypothetical protein